MPSRPVQPRPALADSASPIISRPAEQHAAADAPLPSPTQAQTPAPTPDLSGFGRALARRSGCRDYERLSPAERAICDERLASAPEIRVREANPYVLVGEHVELMAGVRRAENNGRLSCDLSRNFDPTCPNKLPDNLARDYERPKPRR